MKKTKSKGFTLVELLVVIAILAILATVSVVGYTAFIERATVSNDENVAAQLNQFLTAMKADSTGEYYDALQGELTASDVLEITDDIILESGLGELIPQAEQYGYNFYYDLKDNKYVVMESDKAFNVSLMYFMFNIQVGAYSEGDLYELIPQNMFSEGGRYILIGNTELGTILTKFSNVTNKDEYEELEAMVETYTGKLPVREYFNSTVFVTNAGNFGTGTKYVVFAKNLTKITEKLPEIQLSKGIFRIPSTVKYIVGDGLNVQEENKGNVVFVIDKTVVEVGKIASEKFTNAKLITNDGSATFTADGKITAGEESAELKYYNPAVSFTIYIKEDGKHATKETEGSAFVGYDVKNFTLLIDPTAKELDFPCSTKVDELTWTVSSGNNVTNSKNVFSYTGIPDGEVEITASLSYNDAETKELISAENTYTIKTVYPTNFTLKLNGKALSEASSHSLSYTAGTASSYTFAMGWEDATASKYSYDTNGKIEVNETPKVTLSSDTKLSETGDYITVGSDKSGKISEEITFSLAKTSFTKTVTLYDTTDDIFETVNNNIMYVGNGNAFKASDFFKLKDESKKFPSGATLMVLQTASNNDWTDFDTKATNRYIEDGRVSISDLDGEAQFKSDLPDQLSATQSYVCIVVDGIRVSPIVSITAKAGYNVRSYDELKSAVEGGKDAVVLTDKLTMDSNDSISMSGRKLWGNGAEFDVTAGTTHYGLLQITSSELHDIKIIGAVYTEFQMSNGKDYGAAVVNVGGGTCLIENCYIANCREPISIANAILNLKDSVLFGGRMSNVDIRSGGKLNIQGTVTTVQTPYGNDDVLGMGISCWFDDKTKAVNIESGAKLKQYNFLSTDEANKLPDISIKFKDIDDRITDDNGLSVAKTSEMFKELITKDKYRKYWFGDSSNYYANTGIVCIDKYYGIDQSKSVTEKKVSTGYYKYCYVHKTQHEEGYDVNENNCCAKESIIYKGEHFTLNHECSGNRPSVVYNTVLDYVTYTVSKSSYNTGDGGETEFTFTYDSEKFELSWIGTAPAEGNINIKTNDDGKTAVTVKFGSQTSFTYKLTSKDNAVTKSNYTTYLTAPVETSSWMTLTGADGYGTTDYAMGVTGYDLIANADNLFKTSLSSTFTGKGIHSSTLTVDIRSLYADNVTNQQLYHEHLHIAANGAYEPGNVGFNRGAAGCMWTANITSCVDEDNNQKCDICGKAMPTAIEGE